MSNLLHEVRGILANHDKTLGDISWVGCRDFSIPLSRFFELADVYYDSGFGAQHVASDLIVVGDGWHLERNEYDGSEWWEFKTTIERPQEVRDVSSLVDNMWDSLAKNSTKVLVEKGKDYMVNTYGDIMLPVGTDVLVMDVHLPHGYGEIMTISGYYDPQKLGFSDYYLVGYSEEKLVVHFSKVQEA